MLLTGDTEITTNKCLKLYGSNIKGKNIFEYILSEKLGAKPDSKLTVNLLKLSHHGYSSCDTTNNYINPSKILIFNWSKKVNYYYKNNIIQNKNGKNVYYNDSDYQNENSCRSKYWTGTSAPPYTYVNNSTKIYNFANDTLE